MFSQADLDALTGPHVQPIYCAHLVLPSGERRLHAGNGRLVLGGYTWEGVSDPFGAQLVAIDGLEEPLFGSAPAIDIVLSGANREFLKTMWEDRHAIIGARCDIWFAVLDSETGEVLISLKRPFPGKLSAPAFSIVRTSIRAIKLKVVSVWEPLNFPVTGAMWSPAGQRYRYPGDKGMDEINNDIVDDFKK